MKKYAQRTLDKDQSQKLASEHFPENLLDQETFDKFISPNDGLNSELLLNNSLLELIYLFNIVALMKCEDYHTKKVIKVLHHNCLYKNKGNMPISQVLRGRF